MDVKYIDFKIAFESMPGYSALLDIDSPHFTILATTADYLQISGKTKSELIGKGLFDAFPMNPEDPEQDARQNMTASFTSVIETCRPNELPVHRYDIADENGQYAEYYWQVTNRPVVDPSGKIIYIIK